MATTQAPPVPDSGAAASGDGDLSTPHFRVAIVGAGFSGIGMAIRLRQDGIEDFVVLERADDVGGTWRDNTYPGCQCDIPSVLYSYSFAPNPDWSRTYPLQEEIWDYLRRCAQDFGVMAHIRFGHEALDAHWDEDAAVWRIETSRGPFNANVVVGGIGGLSEPGDPDIPGLEDFEGTVFHSARWDHEHDLTGERVAVIGTGASAIQFVPEIQPRVGRLHLFQRTPSWVLPDPDRPLTKWERRLFRALPATQRLFRALLFVIFEATVVGTIVNRRLSSRFEGVGRRHLRRQVPDPELRTKLTPDYTLGCKRITMSDVYYPALQAPNAEVVTERIEWVTPTGIRTADGTEREVDTIILGTGFNLHNHPGYTRVHGRDGRSLGDVWRGNPSAYLGTAIPDFPNFFLLVGPNSAGGFNSIIFTSEAHINYVIECLRTMDRHGLRSVEVRPEVYEAFGRETQRRLSGSVWNAGGCRSWYLTDEGRNVVWWPDFMFKLWQRTRRFDLGSYLTRPAQPHRSTVAASTSREA